MNHLFCLVIIATLMSCNSITDQSKDQNELEIKERAEYAIVVHGGAGTILRENMTPEMELQYRRVLEEALITGEEILKSGGTALEAVEKTIHIMEDSPLFNAGKGAVFNNDGQNELDASVMQGIDQNAGAVGGLRTVKNPISAAIAVMNHSEHVLLTGVGAEQFAKEQELETVDPEYFYTERRWNAMLKAIEEERGAELSESDGMEGKKHGTVGCVALDKSGNIVAGTSTGGMTNKRYNRFGDVPIIGAGTYADNATCGVSCTGHGEYFIRYSVAHDVHARMKYLNESLEEASDQVVNGTLVEKGGSGGLIAIDKYGNVSMPFNSKGMYRGYARPGEMYIAIYDDEKSP